MMSVKKGAMKANAAKAVKVKAGKKGAIIANPTYILLPDSCVRNLGDDR